MFYIFSNYWTQIYAIPSIFIITSDWDYCMYKISYAVFENLLLIFSNRFLPDNNKATSSLFNEVLKFNSHSEKQNLFRKYFIYLKKSLHYMILLLPNIGPRSAEVWTRLSFLLRKLFGSMTLSLCSLTLVMMWRH